MFTPIFLLLLSLLTFFLISDWVLPKIKNWKNSIIFWVEWSENEFAGKSRRINKSSLDYRVRDHYCQSQQPQNAICLLKKCIVIFIWFISDHLSNESDIITLSVYFKLYSSSRKFLKKEGGRWNFSIKFNDSIIATVFIEASFYTPGGIRLSRRSVLVFILLLEEFFSLMVGFRRNFDLKWLSRAGRVNFRGCRNFMDLEFFLVVLNLWFNRTCDERLSGECVYLPLSFNTHAFINRSHIRSENSPYKKSYALGQRQVTSTSRSRNERRSAGLKRVWKA